MTSWIGSVGPISVSTLMNPTSSVLQTIDANVSTIKKTTIEQLWLVVKLWLISELDEIYGIVIARLAPEKAGML